MLRALPMNEQSMTLPSSIKAFCLALFWAVLLCVHLSIAG
jgi:hypothetical protein